MATAEWTNTAPEVAAWSEAVYSGTYHRDTSTANWYSRVKFEVGRVTGTRNIAIKATPQGHKKSGWQAQTCPAYPYVKVDGEKYNGTSKSKSINSASTSPDWPSIADPQYCIVYGAGRNTVLVGGSNTGGTETDLSNPITAPQLLLNVSGTWQEADAVYINVDGSWIEADLVFVNASGKWEQA